MSESSSHLDGHFLRRSVVDVNAAVVGISRQRWVSIPRDSGYLDSARSIMKESRFDILPIEEDGFVKKYLRTKNWNNYAVIEEKDIGYRDAIPFDTQIHDVIKAFAEEERNFYFLTSERTIRGLISIGCLNCRQVRVYLYSLLIDLEVSLSNFISERVSEGELVELIIGAEANRTKTDIKDRYLRDKLSGVDQPIIEYLYLADLRNIIVKKGLAAQLGMSSTKAKKVLGGLNKFRNRVAHPVKSLLVTENPAVELWKRIDQIDALLFALA